MQYNLKNILLLSWFLIVEARDLVGPSQLIKFEPSSSDPWSSWSSWSNCTKNDICYAGTRTRKRKCLHKLLRAEDTDRCTGIYIENQDCPATKCKKIRPVVYADVVEAPMSSFISQECDMDTKYAVASAYSKMIPAKVLDYCKPKLFSFLHGYFNVKQLPGVRQSGLQNMTKVCFEPKWLSAQDVKQMYRFNRVVKSSIYLEDKTATQKQEFVTGVAIVVDDLTGHLEGFYFALPSNKLGYRKVGYRRWKGVGVLDYL